jgi:hypothetical protein
MKNASNKILRITTFLSMLLLTLAGCGGDDDPSAREKALSTLKSKTWTIVSVTVDGTDKTQTYNGMTVSFTDNTIVVANGGVVWLSQDTWQFTNEQAKALLRGDGLEIEIVTLTTSSLVVKLSWDSATYGAGRTHSIPGEYIFTFE